jgi:hypothetical protein
MRKFSYWICFVLVAFATLYAHGTWLLSTMGIYFPFITVFSILSMFGKLTPQLLGPYVPAAVVAVIDFAVLVLVLHRIWLVLVKRQGVPDSYAGIAKFFGYVGAFSFVLAFVGLVLSIALHAGSGVPAGMLLWPALFCVPWAFFLAEVLSFKRRANAA